jgi:ketosteroid isomerase-like protein
VVSEENVERFRGATEAFNRGDLQAWLDFFDPDAVFEPLVAAMEGAYVGHDVIATFMTTIADLYDVFEVDIVEVRDLGDRVLAVGTATGVGKGSGIEQRTPIAIVASFRNGAITRFKDYGDKDRALEAAGLSE